MNIYYVGFFYYIELFMNVFASLWFLDMLHK
jgi:hypothetical protein